jgi:hypothetical protein
MQQPPAQRLQPPCIFHSHSAAANPLTPVLLLRRYPGAPLVHSWLAKRCHGHEQQLPEAATCLLTERGGYLDGGQEGPAAGA